MAMAKKISTLAKIFNKQMCKGQRMLRVCLDFVFSLYLFSLFSPLFDPASHPASHPAQLCTDGLGIGRLETKEEGSKSKFKTLQHEGNVMKTRDGSTREAIVVPLSMK